MKVSELTGPLLAYWVARAQGYQDVRIGSGVVRYSIGTISYDFYLSWDVCGPIIEREKISTHWDGYLSIWKASRDTSDPKVRVFSGKTPLEAAMRCFVASKYGEEVPDE